MSRVKTFDSTGNAPGGRLYSGDLNAIQDQYADLINYSQNHGVGTLAIGEAGLQLVRYGAGEARLTGKLRVDGILRGLGGVFAGQFTTAERDALPAGSRPYGLQILNTTENEFQWNAGSDAAPSWISIQPDAFPVGMTWWYPGAVTLNGTFNGTLQPAGGTPGIYEPVPGWYLMNGAPLLRSQFADLFAMLSTAFGAPDGTSFNIPDLRGGRVPVAQGASAPFDVRGAVGGARTHALSLAELPAHNHGGGIHSHGINDSGHGHGVSDPGHDHGLYHSDVSFNGGSGGIIIRKGWNSNVVDRSAAAGTGIAVAAAATGISVQNSAAVVTSQGSGTAHENMPPHVVFGGLLLKVRML